MGILLCGFCEEPVDERTAKEWETDPPPTTSAQPLHRECAIRMLVGSLAHQQRRCDCYIPGSTESDPPHMTLREAARAAVRLHCLTQARN